jgi:hypothetical protein
LKTNENERVDIERNLQAYLSARQPAARYTSFDYCFNYFQTHREDSCASSVHPAGAGDALEGPGGPKERPAYLGRAIVALASDPRVIEKSGQVVEVGTLAHEYGFTYVNGTQPRPFRIPAST